MKTDKELLEIRERVRLRYEELKPIDVDRFFRNAYAEEPNVLTEEEKFRLVSLSDAPRKTERKKKAKKETKKVGSVSDE